jgi:hypothetical protein
VTIATFAKNYFVTVSMAELLQPARCRSLGQPPSISAKNWTSPDASGVALIENATIRDKRNSSFVSSSNFGRFLAGRSLRWYRSFERNDSKRSSESWSFFFSASLHAVLTQELPVECKISANSNDAKYEAFSILDRAASSWFQTP